MVEIAKAVSYDSDILIMDEPTSALTDREVEHLFKIIRTLKAQGKGIIYITHKMNELFEIADEVSVFRDGRFVGEHAAADVTRDDIIRLMVGREITQMFPKETVPIGDVIALGARPRRSKGGSATSPSICARARFSASPALSARGAATSPRPCSASRRRPPGPSQSTAPRSRSRIPAWRWTPAWRS